ncbi:stress responsive A/B barrel domain-containing protein [Metarhizium acridum CQMa 102]|uniref:Stress responsive A/B barrel domain-containing protein n=1 Tax=Metarhizium acridum (strain CQMa 102) TaxID=655827 RepID=E9DWZ8_METAQ|nr:stress responsive A/B barrel domain-containing protein [Metarhizium acridum CQMa 102]EFY91861.1 stress responsive A/B barrel domain-containing protein [Metarhizium acridum CQMa 102]
MAPIHRVTLFKIESENDRKRLLELYQGMPSKALKDGKPYIQSVTAGPTKPDQRAQGFTFAAISVFKSLDDMEYYDNGCAAHAQLKEFAKKAHSGAMMVYLENGV